MQRDCLINSSSITLNSLESELTQKTFSSSKYFSSIIEKFEPDVHRLFSQVCLMIWVIVCFRNWHCEEIKSSNNDKLTALVYIYIIHLFFYVVSIPYMFFLILTHPCNIGELQGVFHFIFIYSSKECIVLARIIIGKLGKFKNIP